MLTILEVCAFNKKQLVVLKNALFWIKRSRLLTVLNWKKIKRYDSFFRKDLLNVSEKIQFKVFGLLIKVHLYNQKLQSNLVNQNIHNSLLLLFMQSHRTNQTWISIWTLQKFQFNSVTSDERFFFFNSAWLHSTELIL